MPLPAGEVRDAAGRSRVPPVVALAVGVLLWYVPTFGQPLTGPIASVLRALGLLGPEAHGDATWFVATLALRWLAVAALLVFVLTVERLPMSSVGIRMPHWKGLLVTVAVTVVAMVVGYGLYFMVVGDQVEQSTQTGQILASLPFGQLIHLIVNAAVVEELFFRGFLMERLITLTRRPWLAAVVSYLLFVGSHIPGSGLATTLTATAAGSLVFVGLYVRYRNVVLCTGAHALSNTPVLLTSG